MKLDFKCHLPRFILISITLNELCNEALLLVLVVTFQLFSHLVNSFPLNSVRFRLDLAYTHLETSGCTLA